jgi:hypothetical protein
MFQYRNDGGTLTQPIMMPAGAAYSALGSNLQGALHKVDNGSSGTQKVSAYASYSGSLMTVLLINRDLANARTVNLQITGSKSFGPATGYSVAEFIGNYWQSNKNQPAANPPVRWNWSSQSGLAQSCVTSPSPRVCTMTQGISIPAGTMKMVRVNVQ